MPTTEYKQFLERDFIDGVRTAQTPTTLLLYSDTGHGKSLQLGRLAYRIWKETGKITRFVNSDGGGGLDTIQSYLSTGCIEVLDMQEALKLYHGGKPLNPMTLLRAVGKGFWGPVRQVGQRVMMHKLTEEEQARTGMYVFETLSGISMAIQKWYIVTGQKVAQDLVATFQEPGIGDEGAAAPEEKYGKMGLAHYGGIQDFILLDMLPAMQSLPCEIVAYTTHESKGADDLGQGEKVYGPLVIGKAATRPLMKSVGLMMHLDKADTPARPASPGVPAIPAGMEYRAYYLDHPDPLNPQIKWKSQPRVDPALLPALDKTFPGGYVKLVPASLLAPVSPGVGIDDFLLERNRLQKELALALHGGGNR